MARGGWPNFKLPVKVPTAKEVVDKVTDAAKKVINVSILAAISAPLAGLVVAELARMEAQLNDGRAKQLPQWLRNAVYRNYPDVNLEKVRYGESMNLPTPDRNTAMTIGYNIYFPRPINLDHFQEMTGISQTESFASDLHWVLHELEHTSQFLKSGGNQYLWATKYVVATTLSLDWKFSVNATHDSIQLERDADAKADSLLNLTASYFSRGLPTPRQHAFQWHSLVSENNAQDLTEKHPYPTAGINVISQNGRYVFTVQGDGNLTIHITENNTLIWESRTAGKACPPFYLCRTEDRNQLILGGWHFNPKDQTAVWTRIWQTPLFTLSNTGNNGGFYLVDPALKYTAGSDVGLHVTDDGVLSARLARNGMLVVDGYSRPVAIWESPAPGITTQVIVPITTTLPAANRGAW